MASTGTIFSDEFFDGLDSSVFALDAAETLPPACYTDPGFFEFEKECLFNHEWLCVGREAWAAKPGDYFTTSIIGEPIVVVRNHAGVLKALSSVCQHRAMLVAEGHGNAPVFLCPYHHWCYSLDGALLNAPAMERTRNFDKAKFGLPEFKVEVWLGFVFINFDRAAPPLARAPSASSMAGWCRAIRATGPRSGPVSVTIMRSSRPGWAEMLLLSLPTISKLYARMSKTGSQANDKLAKP